MVLSNVNRTRDERDSAPYNSRMGRFLMEHLPRASAVYKATPLNYQEAAAWLGKGEFVSAVRTTEMIDAIQSASHERHAHAINHQRGCRQESGKRTEVFTPPPPGYAAIVCR